MSHGVDSYEKQEKLLSTRTKLTRNIFFANGTSRDQANAAMKQGVTNTSELDFVQKPPRHVPKNIYFGRSVGQGFGDDDAAHKTHLLRQINEDETQIKKMQMQFEQENEDAKRKQDKPRDVVKRLESPLSHPGVSISKLPRFRPDSAASSSCSHAVKSPRPVEGTLSNPVTPRGAPQGDEMQQKILQLQQQQQRARSGSPEEERWNSGLTTARSRPLSAKDAIREVEKENALEEQYRLADHPTHFVEREIAEYREHVRVSSARPTFGPPPPLPESASKTQYTSVNNKVIISRPSSGSNNNQQHHHHHKRVGSASSSSSASASGVGGPSRPTSAAASITAASSFERASDFVFPWEVQEKKKTKEGVVDTAAVEEKANLLPLSIGEEEERDRAEAAWQEERQRLLDNWGLIQSSGGATGPGSKDANKEAKLALKKRAATLARLRRTQPTFVDITRQVDRQHSASYHARSYEHHDLFYTTKDDKTGKVRHVPDIKLDKYANRSYNVKPFYYVPADLLQADHLLKTNRSMVQRERHNFVKLLTDATNEELKLLGRMREAERDPMQIARCEAAKSFLEQFCTPDSVDVPGLPISAADDARFNDGFTTTTRARPKTSGEAIVTRRFKGVPQLGSYSDRPADDFTNDFGTSYQATRKQAAREIDAELRKAEMERATRRRF